MNDMKQKGFYFSFDALLALTVIAMSIVFLLQSSSPIQSTVDATVSEYRQTNTHAEDSVQLATHSTLQEAFPPGFTGTYVEDTVLDAEDLDESVLDAIAILWASGEEQTAANVTQEYFRDAIPDEYGFRLTVLDDMRYTIYNTSTTDEIENLANAKRIVSGVQKDRPQQGYLARARAVQVEKNESEVLTFSPMGGANSGGRLNIRKQFNISDAQNVVNGTLYIGVHYGCDNSQFENLRINGNNFKNEITWIHQDEDNCPSGSGTGAYGVVHNMHQYLENGTNTVYMRFRNNNYNAHTHPGMKLELEKTSQGKRDFEGTERQERIEFDDVESDERGNDNVGAFAVKPFSIPNGATIESVQLHLQAEEVNQVYDEAFGFCGAGGTYVSDVMVYFNGEQVYSDYAPSDGDVELEMDLTDQSEEGTNVVAAYFNTFGDCFWGSDVTRIVSDYTSPNSSYINVSYEIPQGDLVFGKIELTRNEHLGGPLENPKTYEKDFNGSEVLSSYLHVAQLFSDRVLVDVTDPDGTTGRAFTSEGVRSVPSSIFIDPALYQITGDNTIYMEDETVDNDFLPESSFEYTQLVPSQVGYGDTFQNRSSARDDAVERLNETLGPFVTSTELQATSFSVNNVPWLFGPVTMDLEVWKKDE